MEVEVVEYTIEKTAVEVVVEVNEEEEEEW